MSPEATRIAHEVHAMPPHKLAQGLWTARQERTISHEEYDQLKIMFGKFDELRSFMSEGWETPQKDLVETYERLIDESLLLGRVERYPWEQVNALAGSDPGAYRHIAIYDMQMTTAQVEAIFGKGKRLKLRLLALPNNQLDASFFERFATWFDVRTLEHISLHNNPVSFEVTQRFLSTMMFPKLKSLSLPRGEVGHETLRSKEFEAIRSLFMKGHPNATLRI